MTLFAIPAEDEGEEDVILPATGVDFVAVIPSGSYPNIYGRYTDSYTVDVTNCRDSGDNGIYGGTLVMNINSQSGENFSGFATGILVFEAGVSAQENIELSGKIAESGAISGTTKSSGITPGTGTFTGQLTGDTLTITNSGQDTAFDTCSYTRYMTATR